MKKVFYKLIAASLTIFIMCSMTVSCKKGAPDDEQQKSGTQSVSKTTAKTVEKTAAKTTANKTGGTTGTSAGNTPTSNINNDNKLIIIIIMKTKIM